MKKNLLYKLFLLLLVVSQWFMLAHASEHQIDTEDRHCVICTLHDKWQTAVLSTPPIPFDLQKFLIRHDYFDRKSIVQTILTGQVRAPPA